MTIKSRILPILLVGLATLWMAGCGHYTCGLTFGSSTCGSSGSTGLNQGTGTGSTTAFVYAVDTAGTIDSYSLNNGAATFAATSSYTAPTVPANDGGKGMVVAQSQFLYAGFGVAAALYGWSIDSSTGALTSVTGSPYTATFMPDVPGQNPHAMITNPAGTLLFIADAAPAEIWVYQIGTDGSLTAATGSPFSTGSLVPGALTTDGLGKYLYITQNSSTNTGTEVGAYAISSGSNLGALTLVPGSPFGFPMGQVQGEPSGKFLIGTTGNAEAVSGTDLDELFVFAIAQSGSNAGSITEVAGSPFTTVSSPLTIAVQPNTGGNLVYSFGLNDTATGFNAPEAYQIDPTTGALTAVSGSPFSNAAVGDIAQFDQSGTNVFVLGQVLNTSTNTLTDTLGAFALGSDGLLTEPTTGITFATPGTWTVTDPK
jgi:6-phosphogluconolactonase (cycloisomerase 2 family)